ncbi:hypothetical protein BU23DRAFT_595992 [Bimuria novae-zelandiae CBS 107.79]|uniref:SMP-30/Gluconolactonase/LRE-like region domain-containing protein n=1 Tax=Bimuria novae-zelandiae CBS 107.79 TaxID=1447943 RepID=A0A6A5VRC3_9PLEO|nr:hypothetical protein BU23DRAFT_595992 [Bimuria novae-zelandiae CBS 107.79]
MRPASLYLAALIHTGTSLAASVRIVHQFPNPTWVENIASTRNGSLLAGILGTTPAQLHILDPFSNTSQDTLLHTFPYSNAIFGITEYKTDVFAVAAGNFSATTANGTGDANIWSVDLSRGTSPNSAKVKKIAYLPRAQINGLAALDSETLLFTDSWAGNIRKVDIRTGKYEVILQDASTAHNVSGVPLSLGANGLKVLRSDPVPSSRAGGSAFLYFSNLQLGGAYRVQIDARTGRPQGRVVMLATGLGEVDDLAVTEDGTAFVARDEANDIVRIGLDGEVGFVSGEHKEIQGPTSAVLGRTYRDRGVLYVGDYGGLTAEGSYIRGGRVTAVDLTV